MSTIQGIINKSVVNAEQQFERLGYVSTNFANYNTPGYRSIRFEQVLNENGYLSGVERTNHAPGAIQRTENELDVAIDGKGFIPVTSPEGDVAYTRCGSFRVNKDGYLMTNDNHLVGDGIQLPVNYKSLVIHSNGKVEIIKDESLESEVIGHIPIVDFKNPEGLKKGDNNKYYLTAESGEPVLIKEHSRLKQGNIETTNIDLYNEINTVLRLNASLLASFKVMKTINQMYTNALQLTQ